MYDKKIIKILKILLNAGFAKLGTKKMISK